MKKTLILLIFIPQIIFSQQVRFSKLTAENKPWTRWWWHGNAVNNYELSQNLIRYEKAGLGGVEITPIFGVKGKESDFLPFLSPQWMHVLDYAIMDALRLNMQVDIATGTGWPFGGPWVEDKDACKFFTHKTYSLKNGEKLAEPIVFHQEGFVRAVNNPNLKLYDLKEPITANADLQKLAIDQVRYEKDLPLHTLMAYSNDGKTLEITDKVDKNGVLNWITPAGNWTLYAIFMGNHGKMVERSAPGGEGNVIDHFDENALKNYLKPFDKAFQGHQLTQNIRSFFNDSYEVDDARGQADFTPLFFEEFKKRRGYDLKNMLPYLFNNEETPTNQRIRSDYRETIGELVLEKFTQIWQVWARNKGALVRNQSHGSPANILDLYAAIDIPETEGRDILRFKFATSAANIMNKKLASAEACTWLDEHFQSTPSDIKKALDDYFLGGVNHIVYHGTAFSPENEPFPGRLFYAAVHFMPHNPFWKDFAHLNTYIGKTQSFLQRGKADNDILIYFPIYDRYAEMGKGMLHHFDGMEGFDKTNFKEISENLLKKGYAFDFISDKQIQGLNINNQQIISNTSSYQTIVLPANEYINPTTFSKLLDLVKNGATLIVYKNLPSSPNGFGDLANRQQQLDNLIGQLQFSAQNNVQIANLGKGKVLKGENIEALMQFAKIRKETIGEQNIQSFRRKTENVTYYFLVNRNPHPIQSWLPLATNISKNKATYAAIYDAMNDKCGLAKFRKNTTGNIEIYVELQPNESCIVEISQNPLKGDFFPYYTKTKNITEIKGNWTLKFEEGGENLAKPITINTLEDWTKSTNDTIKNFSGIARYSINFAKPKGKADAYQIQLENIGESAEIFINKQKIGTTFIAPFQLIFAANLLKDNNLLEIVVSNSMFNRIKDIDQKGILWKRFYNTNFPANKRQNVGSDGLFDPQKLPLKSSGIIGKVWLSGLKVKK